MKKVVGSLKSPIGSTFAFHGHRVGDKRHGVRRFIHRVGCSVKWFDFNAIGGIRRRASKRFGLARIENQQPPDSN